MKLTFTLLCFFAMQCAMAQKSSSIYSIDFVKVKNDNLKEALYYYDKNWKYNRVKALEKGYIASYQIMQSNPEDAVDFQLMLITEYPNRKAFEASEERFGEIIKEKGELTLLNDKKPGEFREVIMHTTTTSVVFDHKKMKKRN